VLVVAAPLFGAWSDRIGRRPLLLASCVGFMLLTHPLFRLIVARRTPGIVTAAQVVFDLMIALFSGPGVAAIAEMFPTASRLTWMSVGYTVSVTVSGGFAPYVATWLIGATRSPLAPAYYLIAAAATSALVIGLMPESAHAELG
jgi:MHS family proline/betaine transporter-like MFS transporter